MPFRQILGRNVGPGRGRRGVQKAAVFRQNFIRQAHVALRSIAQIEMGRAALFDAGVENHLPAVGDRFQVGLHHARNIVDALLGVALGGRQGIAFLDRQGFADFRLRDLMNPVEIDEVDSRRLGERRRAQTHK